MTTKEKADELVYKVERSIAVKFNISPYETKIIGKDCAILFVDEILEIFKGLHKPEYVTFDIYEPKQYHMEEDTDYNGYAMSEYWEQVKVEINEL